MKYIEHRQELKVISKNLNQVGTVDERMNKKLEKFYSHVNDDIKFRTFEDWNSLGYKVKKNEKAYKFWGKPVDFEIRNLQDNRYITDIGSYFPIIFKFSENQVYKLDNLR